LYVRHDNPLRYEWEVEPPIRASIRRAIGTQRYWLRRFPDLA
jgi:hypothetical protein